MNDTIQSSAMPKIKKQRKKLKQRKKKAAKFINNEASNTWFDAQKGVHLVRKGDSIVPDKGYLKGLQYPLAQWMSRKEMMLKINDLDSKIKHTRSVQYHGPVAGQSVGDKVSCGDQDWLVTSSPNLIEPVKGKFPHIRRLIETMLPDEAARLALYSWHRVQYSAISRGQHSKCPMLILAGDADDGKSFFMKLSTILRGGREVNPIKVWSGEGASWTDHMVGAECLNIDDSLAAKDYKSRVALGTKFKEAVYADGVTVDKRHCSSFTLNPRPAWGVMMAVNANGQAIRVVPAVDEEGMSDKMVILRTQKAEIHLRESGDEGAKERLDCYLSELPAFAYWLLNEFEPPEALPEGCSVSRSGAVVYRDSEAMRILHDESPAGQLEEAILEFRDRDNSLIQDGASYTTSQLKGLLECTTQTNNDTRIPRSTKTMGIYLSQFADREGGCIASAGKDRNGCRLWTVVPLQQ